MDLKAYLEKKKDLVDGALRAYLSSLIKSDSLPERLYNSISYSLMAGGKRLRPILAIAAYEACGGTGDKVLPVAAALELIHTYSLIHDDLPSMDNDDLRRGKPTNHRVFGEATAILTGDALLTDAFNLISESKADPEVLLNVIKEISRASGSRGMVGGQAADIYAEGNIIGENEIRYIHAHKTAALIRTSLRVGVLMAEASPEKLHSLTRYGEGIGLAFQIVDDILDVEGSSEELGKSTGADSGKGKNTYPSIFGLEESKKKAEALIKNSLKAIEGFDEKAEPLREIAMYVLKRRN
ncbi:MAG: polyprenyl synthetase family protein [Nitrospirae bacterium]|nr:polyprenyl synthetase family protein [Nitrospirota bacterium]